MKKKNLILSIILFTLFLFVSSFLYSFFFIRPREETKYLKNITELYSSFTDYMKETVDYRLKLLACEPKEYYYDNSNLCFVCGKIHACFGFGWVNRTGGERMNPKGRPYLTNYEKFGVEIADFYEDGLASLFECVKKDDETLSCVDDIVFVKDDDDVKMMLTDEHKLEDASNRICAHFGNPSPDCRESVCSCGNKQIIFTNEQLFVYDILL